MIIGYKNVLIAGDAAGLVEPITGEGISFAMQSGKFAAEAVLSAQSAGSPEMAYRLYKQKYTYLKKTLFKVKLFRYFDHGTCRAQDILLTSANYSVIRDIGLIEYTTEKVDLLDLMAQKFGGFHV